MRACVRACIRVPCAGAGCCAARAAERLGARLGTVRVAVAGADACVAGVPRLRRGPLSLTGNLPARVDVQERANSSPGLQAFLEKKGDEHAFSCLYRIAGIVCLYAAFSHGPEFCAMAPAAEVAKTVPALAAAAAPHRALLAQRVTATSKARLAAMKGNMLDEEAPAAEEAPAEGEEGAAAEAPAAAGDNSTQDSAGASGDDQGSEDDDSASSEKAPMATFIGPHGWVVTWLTVEGFTGRCCSLLFS